MVKPPVDTFEKMINFIHSQVRAKRFVENYQPVMIRLLLEKGNQSRQQIAQELWIQNNEEREQSHYHGVPVYGVLENNGIVTKNKGVTKKEDIFLLVLQNISKSEKQILLDEIESSISRQENFSKTGFLPWKEAKLAYQKIVSENNIKTQTEFQEFIKTHPLPDNLPSNPSAVYSKENILKKMDKEK